MNAPTVILVTPEELQRLITMAIEKAVAQGEHDLSPAVAAELGYLQTLAALHAAGQRLQRANVNGDPAMRLPTARRSP